MPQSNFVDIAYQQSEIGGGDIHSWRLTLDSRKSKIGIYRDLIDKFVTEGHLLNHPLIVQIARPVQR